jgi:hypothetical protein
LRRLFYFFEIDFQEINDYSVVCGVSRLYSSRKMKQPHSIFYPLVIGADHPILRKKSEPIMEFSKEIQDFSDILLALMYEYDGIGLAAPQLGENIRMIAVTHRKEQK